MSMNQLAPQIEEIIYPESDGKPMADNTKQFDWITNIVQNLRTLFQHEKVFVAGDLLWYSVKGDNKKVKAPDAMVVFGRPKHHRGSYKQWLEDNIPPQVVFEILSPGNDDSEMEKKFQFYQTYQVEEYYLYDPDKNRLKGWIRGGNRLFPIVPMDGWISPRLKIRFERSDEELILYHPDGKRFTSHEEEAARAEEAEQRAIAAEAEIARLKALLAKNDDC
jgi:Uma2 family endonuclease